MADQELADIVLVNESGDARVAGDVSVFRSVDAACGYLEPWWVEDDEGFACTAAGERLTLGVDAGGKVVVVGTEVVPDGPEIVRLWLQAAAASVLEARRIKAARGGLTLSRCEELGELPTSVEGLVAYVGFSD